MKRKTRKVERARKLTKATKNYSRWKSPATFRLSFFLDADTKNNKPLIYANLSQSHSVFFARLHSANRLVFALLSQTLSGTQALRSCLWLSRFRSLAECWTRASALAGDSLCSVSLFLILSCVSSNHAASAEARVQHLAERWRLATSILFRVCESEGRETRSVSSHEQDRRACERARCDWLRLAWISGRSKKYPCADTHPPRLTRKLKSANHLH